MVETSPRALVAGNWKMNGSHLSFEEVRLLATMLSDVKLRCDVMICPPATLITPLGKMLGGAPVAVGGQDCHGAPSGAFTGDISAEMLGEAGAEAIIVGHSERRIGHGESAAIVRGKAVAAHRAGLTAIVCIGETATERGEGRALDVLTEQLLASLPEGVLPGNTVIAYEPVWAIGTGQTPTLEQVREAHNHIRQVLAGRIGSAPAHDVRVLYGGSVKPDNAEALMGVENVNGALVGGASLKAADFIGIIKTFA